MGKHAVRLTEDKILYGEIVGDSDEADALDFATRVKDILAVHPGQNFDSIVNLGHAGAPTVEAERVFADLIGHPQIKRVAFVEPDGIPRIFAQFAAKLAHKEQVRFFEKMESARAWLFSEIIG